MTDSFLMYKDIISFDEKGAITTIENILSWSILSYYITENERKDIFKNQTDREKFLSYLESATEKLAK